MNLVLPFERIATGPTVRRLISKLVRNSAVTYGPARPKRIAITFDDGPHAKWTPKVLDVLAHHKAFATFFVVGENAEKHSDIVRNMIEQGHEIAVHGYQHHRQLVDDIDVFRVDLQRAIEVITEIIGKSPVFYRYPYGTPGRQTDRVVDGCKLCRVYWSFSACDTYLPSEQQISLRVTRLMRPGAIVLMHDCLADADTTPPPYRPDRTEMLKSLDRILTVIRTKALEPVTLSTLLAP